MVLRNQFYNIYTWKDFPLTIIHSFKYSMVSSDFEILQSFIVESSKQRVLISIQNALQICLLGNLVIIRYFQTSSGK